MTSAVLVIVLVAAAVIEYVESPTRATEEAWGRVETDRAYAGEELLDFVSHALELTARNHAVKAAARALGAEPEYSDAEIRAAGPLELLLDAGRKSGKLRSDLTVSDVYLVVAFCPTETLERWLALIRPALLRSGENLSRQTPRVSPRHRPPLSRGTPPSVVVAILKDHQVVAADEIHEPMLLCDAPRPRPGCPIPELFRFPDPAEGIAETGIDEREQRHQSSRFVAVLPARQRGPGEGITVAQLGWPQPVDGSFDYAEGLSLEGGIRVDEHVDGKPVH